MMRLFLVSMIAAWGAAQPALAAPPCGATTELAPPIDALGPAAAGRTAGSIEFSAPVDAVAGGAPKHATAWTARLHQAVIGGDGWIEAAWLAPRRDCAGYQVAQRARAVVPAAQYTAFVAAIEPFALPPKGAFSPETQMRDELEGGGSAGGTIDLRLSARNWTVARALPGRSEDGARLLRLFAQLSASRLERAGLGGAGAPAADGE